MTKNVKFGSQKISMWFECKLSKYKKQCVEYKLMLFHGIAVLGDIAVFYASNTIKPQSSQKPFWNVTDMGQENI